jgi:hypothetical protein
VLSRGGWRTRRMRLPCLGRALLERNRCQLTPFQPHFNPISTLIKAYKAAAAGKEKALREARIAQAEANRHDEVPPPHTHCALPVWCAHSPCFDDGDGRFGRKLPASSRGWSSTSRQESFEPGTQRRRWNACRCFVQRCFDAIFHADHGI